jgi:hypothetical protein
MSDETKDVKPIAIDAELVDGDTSDYPVLAPGGSAGGTSSAIVEYASSNPDQYGLLQRKSKICTICNKLNHTQINMARARDHKKLGEIAAEFSVTVHDLRTHFRAHFIINENQQRIIDFKEDDSTEAKEIITKVFERNTDLLDGAQSVLQSKAVRLSDINLFLKDLADKREIDALNDVEKQEYVQYHKLANDLENSILQTYVTMDKKMFPFRKEDLGLAVTSYKLSVLSKLLDQVQLVFLEFEKVNPQYSAMIKEMRTALAEKFNEMEDIISKSGGLITPLGGE